MASRHLNKFKYREDDIAAILGLSQRRLGVSRNEELVRGTHWVIQSRFVYYSWTGVRQLLAKLGILEAIEVGEVACRADDRMRSRETAPILDAIVKGQMSNQCMLEASIEGLVVEVAVRNNTKFLPGMKIRVRRIGDRHTLVGHCPRWLGKF